MRQKSLNFPIQANLDYCHGTPWNVQDDLQSCAGELDMSRTWNVNVPSLDTATVANENITWSAS